MAPREDCLRRASFCLNFSLGAYFRGHSADKCPNSAERALNSDYFTDILLVMTYSRILDLASLAEKKSLFLFGPRSTGKTTLLKAQFPENAIINLLKSNVFLSLSADPSQLAGIAKEIARTSSVVVIDEIQKLPALLDEVHNAIETDGIRFVLTGSSARKLKRSGVNLLAGRAWQCNLFPLSFAEITDFDLDLFLLYGGLPQVYGSAYPAEELDAYINTYLKEEIKEEALVQNFTHFARFLKVASLSNGEQLNFATVSRETGVPATSIRAWFDILSDTFTGFLLESWRGSKKRRAVSTAKFYLFDVGVANFLRGTTVLGRNSVEFRKAFEHFIAMELRAFLSYRRIKMDLTYWRTQTGIEVDFIIGDDTGIEVKSALKVTDKHLKGLRALKDENILRQFFLVSLDELDRETPDGIRLLFWKSFLVKLWNGEILS